ncbi:MAG: DUF599 domain-containing protein [Thermoplasmatota archaeon]
MHLSTITALLVFGVCLFGYHHAYFWVTTQERYDTKKSRIDKCVESWIESAVEDRDYLLVVHQIRNMIMAITFLATIAAILMGFLLNFANVGHVINEFNFSLTRGDYPVWLIIFTLGYSILNFLLSLRYLTQLTYLVRSDRGKLRDIEGSDAVMYLRKLFIIGNRQYTMGRRSMLYSITALSWFVNVWLFIGLTIALTLSFAYLHDI